MLSGIIENISDLFSDGGNVCIDGDSGIMDYMGHPVIDLSMYGADEIREALNAAFPTDGMNGLETNYGHDIPFGAASDVDARNLAKSTLISKLNSSHVSTGNLYTDRLWGGLDSYSGNKVYDAINSARDNNRISESMYRELVSLLKKACQYQ